MNTGKNNKENKLFRCMKQDAVNCYLCMCRVIQGQNKVSLLLMFTINIVQCTCLKEARKCCDQLI
jgi:hypothetical protein